MLRGIYNSTDEDGEPLGSPPTFCALLFADGDRLGKFVSELWSYNASQALSKFIGEVPKIVKKFDGVTIYAAADGVLAMLPGTMGVGVDGLMLARFLANPEEG